MASERPMLQRSGRALDLPIGAVRNRCLLEGSRCLPQPHGLAAASVRLVRFAPPRTPLRRSCLHSLFLGGATMRRLRLETTTYGEVKPTAEDVEDRPRLPPRRTPLAGKTAGRLGEAPCPDSSFWMPKQFLRVDCEGLSRRTRQGTCSAILQIMSGCWFNGRSLRLIPQRM
jgi:hypothetical protein